MIVLLLGVGAPNAADLDEGALEGDEAVGAEVVGGLAARAEVEGLVSAAIGGAGERGGRRVGEEHVHVLGAAGAVHLGAEAPRVELVGAPLPLAPLLLVPVPRGGGGGAGDVEAAAEGADRGALREEVAAVLSASDGGG